MGNSFSLLTGIQKVWKNAARLFMQRDDSGLPPSSFSSASFVVGSVLSLILLQGCVGRVPLPPQEDSKNWDCVPVLRMHELRSDLSLGFGENSLVNKTLIDHAIQSGLEVCVYDGGGVDSEQAKGYGAAAFYDAQKHAVVVVAPQLPPSSDAHEFGHVEQALLTDHDRIFAPMIQEGHYMEALQRYLLKEAGATALQAIDIFKKNKDKESLARQTVMEAMGGDPHALLVLEIFKSLGEKASSEEDLGSKDRLIDEKLLDRLMATYLAKGLGPHVASRIQRYKDLVNTYEQSGLKLDPVALTDKEITEATLGTLYPDAKFALTKNVLSEMSQSLSGLLRKELKGETVDLSQSAQMQDKLDARITIERKRVAASLRTKTL